MLKSEILVSLALLAVWLLGAGCSGATDAAVAQDSEGETPQEAAPPVLVRLGEFRRGDISARLPVSADLEAVDEADVYAEVSGVIREVRYREGSFVPRGEAAVILADEDLAMLEENKRILRDQAKTKLEQARLSEKEGKAMLEQKKLLFEQAEAEYQRALQAAKDGLLSPEETEAKRYERDQARIDTQSASLGLEKSALAEKEAEQMLQLAEVELRKASYDLSRTHIRAPIDGYISYLEVKPGEIVRASSGAINVPAPVFSIINLERLEARVYAPQRELRRLRPKQRVRMSCEVYPDEEFWGEVDVINPVIDKDVRTVRVIVGVNDPRQLLKPGMFVNAEIVLDTHEDAWLVPKKAILYENQEPIVFVLQGDVAQRCRVRKGYSSEEEVEVLELIDEEGREVDPGTVRLVLVGQNKLEDGSPVEIE